MGLPPPAARLTVRPHSERIDPAARTEKGGSTDTAKKSIEWRTRRRCLMAPLRVDSFFIVRHYDSDEQNNDSPALSAAPPPSLAAAALKPSRSMAASSSTSTSASPTPSTALSHSPSTAPSAAPYEQSDCTEDCTEEGLTNCEEDEDFEPKETSKVTFETVLRCSEALYTSKTQQNMGIKDIETLLETTFDEIADVIRSEEDAERWAAHMMQFVSGRQSEQRFERKPVSMPLTSMHALSLPVLEPLTGGGPTAVSPGRPASFSLEQSPPVG